ncbi:phosphate butyryltransferase [Sedimentibacter hydroxybenzoicus DSM 7310]|uniref:Phosphate butyryltransferase n=1 Tax=Sedimentibacter hydroxybenzoicus DSM 7310 TaxID=1123245 RepID=A0A974GXE6_SEDHY|nr:phosphate butyryltransferase [Sedimentibacter hydroxybenzoicus]NYB75517.1 phosphate butyryltransferase [Sedimentibacter hydroxybenzoicus DSM 7310]
MIKFDEIIKYAQDYANAMGPKKIAVANAQDEDVLKAIKEAVNENICKPILVGDADKITELAETIELDLNNIDIIDEKDGNEACRKAVELVSSGKADIVMKGLIDTSIILKAVLDKEIGLRTGNVLSHAAVFSVDTYHKFFIVTDAAMSIAPDAEEKRQIIENTLTLSRALGAQLPKVAVICAKEKVNPKMPATLDAQELVQMQKDGKITGCIIEGPYALDNAISKEAAEVKGIKGEAAGDADILLMPDIEAGNILYKALTYLANAENAGIILGAKAPIVLTSRADSDKAKLNSIALSVLCSSFKGE